MLSYTDVKPGMYITLDNHPYYVVSADFLRMQQRKAVVKVKIKSLISGNSVEKSLQPSDSIEEAEIEKMESKFLYNNRGVYWFDEINNPKNRFSFNESELDENTIKFLKPNMPVSAFKFNDKIMNIELPIKADYKVKEAPPGVKGDTAQGGSKLITLESGAKISAPLFINEGDVVRVNTESGEYVERIEKA